MLTGQPELVYATSASTIYHNIPCISIHFQTIRYAGNVALLAIRTK